MDFVGNSGPQHSNQAQSNSSSTSKKSKLKEGKALRIMSALILVFTALLIGLVALYLSLGGSKKESEYVDTSKFQAIFLNSTTQPPYFAKIRSINSKYITIDNIYYLQVNQQVQPTDSSKTTANDVKLVKLGCELHAPYDKMIINRDQVLYWENLKSDGQVAQAITKYVQANPTGQKCESAAASSTTKQ